MRSSCTDSLARTGTYRCIRAACIAVPDEFVEAAFPGAVAAHDAMRAWNNQPQRLESQRKVGVEGFFRLLVHSGRILLQDYVEDVSVFAGEAWAICVQIRDHMRHAVGPSVFDSWVVTQADKLRVAQAQPPAVEVSATSLTELGAVVARLDARQQAHHAQQQAYHAQQQAMAQAHHEQMQQTLHEQQQRLCYLEALLVGKLYMHQTPGVSPGPQPAVMPAIMPPKWAPTAPVAPTPTDQGVASSCVAVAISPPAPPTAAAAASPAPPSFQLPPMQSAATAVHLWDTEVLPRDAARDEAWRRSPHDLQRNRYRQYQAVSSVVDALSTFPLQETKDRAQRAKDVDTLLSQRGKTVTQLADQITRPPSRPPHDCAKDLMSSAEEWKQIVWSKSRKRRQAGQDA
eukprot:TRINITY_DN273_c0_g1_i11.p1 TRINITY_DN273_c0_g1~~TRINITY_DN273_c0_g1_i11.p1  ORF type:complete len:400 (+),score=68.61 TRINITY_DN273_c0_g1_i11:1058-2257(+)